MASLFCFQDFSALGDRDTFTKRVTLLCFYLQVVLFAILLYHVYTSVRGHTFLSMQGDTVECRHVSAPLTTSYLISSVSSNADYYAWGSGSTQSRSLGTSFKVDLLSFTGSLDNLKELIASAGVGLAELGERGSSRNLAWNVLAWSTFGFSTSSTELGAFNFQSLVHPSVVFDQPVLLGALGGSRGHCRAKQSVSFSPETVSYVLTVEDIPINGSCGSMLKPDRFDTSSASSEGAVDVTMRFDMHSFTLAAALNAGLIGLDSLVMLPGVDLPVTRSPRELVSDPSIGQSRDSWRSRFRAIDEGEDGKASIADSAGQNEFHDRLRRQLSNRAAARGSEHGRRKRSARLHGRRLTSSTNTATAGSFAAYYIPRWVGMEPIYCFSYDSGGFSCFLLVHNTLMFPVANSFGTGNFDSVVASLSDRVPVDFSSSYCNCSVEMTAAEQTSCDAFALISSLIYFPEDLTEGIDMFNATLHFAHAASQRLLRPGGDVAVAASAYGPSMAALYSESGFDFNPFWTEIMQPLCDNCTVISILSSGDHNAINKYGLTLPSPSCGSNFFPRRFAEQIVEASPAALSQIAYECTLSPENSLLLAVTISLGVAVVIGALVRLLLLFGYISAKKSCCRSSELPQLIDSKEINSNPGFDAPVPHASVETAWSNGFAERMARLSEEDFPPRGSFKFHSEVSAIVHQVESSCESVERELTLLTKTTTSCPCCLGPPSSQSSGPCSSGCGCLGSTPSDLSLVSASDSDSDSSFSSCSGCENCENGGNTNTRRANVMVDISRDIFDIDAGTVHSSESSKSASSGNFREISAVLSLDCLHSSHHDDSFGNLHGAPRSESCSMFMVDRQNLNDSPCHTFVTSRQGPGPFTASGAGPSHLDDSPCHTFVTSRQGPGPFTASGAGPSHLDDSPCHTFVTSEPDPHCEGGGGSVESPLGVIVNVLQAICKQQRGCVEAVQLLNERTNDSSGCRDSQSADSNSEFISPNFGGDELGGMISLQPSMLRCEHMSSTSDGTVYVGRAIRTDNTDTLCAEDQKADDDYFYDV